MNLNFIYTFFILLGLNTVTLCQGIHYIESISLSNAIELAKSQKKLIFIDTYADWCIPCKKMDIELSIPEVSSFFNANYLNVKIDVDNSIHSSEYRKKFDIVFLPTLILLDHEGNIKYSIDKMISGREFMQIANKALDPNVYFASDAAAVITDPISHTNKNSGNLSGVSTAPTKIVYTSGKSDNVPPDILYQEAYFRIELMDGSHKPVADKYLRSQTDWASPKNKKFILDFTESASQLGFPYLRDHVDEFITEFGKDRVQLTAKFLAEERLNFGYPRPDFNEAISLYRMMGDPNPQHSAEIYYLDRLESECQWNEYWTFGQEYVLKYPEAHCVYYNLALHCPHEDRVTLQLSEKYITKALTLRPNVALYHECYADILHKLGEKKKAKKALESALKIVDSSFEGHYAFHLKRKKNGI